MSAAGQDAEAAMVCEYGLRLRSSAPVDLAWLVSSDDPADPCGGWNTERWSTPWTALRWAVPALCGWRGRAVYLDCPTVVLGDVAELAAAPFPEGACVLLRREGSQIHTGCLVFDCAAARGKLPGIDALRADIGAHQAVGALLQRHPGLAGDLPGGWGARDQDYSRDSVSVTGSVHCAAPRVQPHFARARARLRAAGRRHWLDEVPLPHYCPGLVDLWEREYAAALAAGYEVEQYVLDKGGVRDHGRARETGTRSAWESI